MRITIKVKPNARLNAVDVQPDGVYLVSVSVPPTEGKANERVIELLAKYFRKPKRAFKIVMGETRREKVIEVE
jgi:uncharacterized protein (TIGR00251 family)